MGLWGASQAIAAGLGGLFGAAAVDVARHVTDDATAFGGVFTFEAMLFVISALMAAQIIGRADQSPEAAEFEGEKA